MKSLVLLFVFLMTLTAAAGSRTYTIFERSQTVSICGENQPPASVTSPMVDQLRKNLVNEARRICEDASPAGVEFGALKIDARFDGLDYDRTAMCLYTLELPLTFACQ